MLDTRLYRALQLRNVALEILYSSKGHKFMDCDGIVYRVFRSGDIRIELQLPIRGSSMPFWLEVFWRNQKRLCLIWFAWPGDGGPEILRDTMDAELESELRKIAAADGGSVGIGNYANWRKGKKPAKHLNGATR
jgi:hypothetical protein